jgi:hypothetical protein
MDKAFIVQRVANKVWSTEDAVDTAMAEAAALMGELVAGRQEMKVAASTTEKATADLVAAIAALQQARTALIEMHTELAEVKLRVGVRTKLIGGWDKHQAAAPEDLRQIA